MTSYAANDGQLMLSWLVRAPFFFSCALWATHLQRVRTPGDVPQEQKKGLHYSYLAHTADRAMGSPENSASASEG